MSISISSPTCAWLARLTTAEGRPDNAVLAIEAALHRVPDGTDVRSFTVYQAADADELWLHEVGLSSAGPQAQADGTPLLVPVALRACSGLAAGDPAVLALAPVRETAGGDAAASVVASAGSAEKLVIWCRLTAAVSREDLLSALEPLMRAFDADPGTEIFTLYTSPDDPLAVWMHEVYTDKAALAEHGRTRATMRGREAAEAALGGALGAPPDNTYVRARLQYRPGRPVTVSAHRAGAA